jgi:hypothetical protein
MAASGKKPRLSLQPFADNPSALLARAGPRFREAVIGNFIALDAEGALNEPGGMIGVIGVDRLLQQIGHVLLADDLDDFGQRSTAGRAV